jgi:hypothetical protein
MKCVHHPGRNSVLTYGGQCYCQECESGIVKARQQVNGHVEPKECFVWYERSDTWVSIAGTGCAHWVAHQLSIKRGGSERCLLGFTYRVRTLVNGLKEVPNINEVRLNDIWVSAKVDHVGLVFQILPAQSSETQPTIFIKHDSSRQGGVSVNAFSTYFHGHGKFYRRP